MNSRNLQMLSVRGIPLAKQYNAQGEWAAFPKAFKYDHFVSPVDSIQGLADALQAAGAAGACFIQGSVNTDRQGIRRLVHDKVEGGRVVPSTIAITPITIAAFDIDGLVLPPELRDSLLDPAAIAKHVAGFLDPEFHAASCVVQFTSKHGFKPSDAYIRLWFVIEPTNAPALKACCERANDRAESNAFDTAIFNGAQIHYLAPPVFENPAADPLQGQARFALVTGSFDTVTAPAVEALPQAQARPVAKFQPIAGLTPALAAWTAGEIPDAGLHPALLRQAIQGVRLGFKPASLTAAIKLALIEGLPASDLSTERQADIARRTINGDEVDAAVKWAETTVQAQGVVSLKGVWGRDLAAGGRAADRWGYATAMLTRYASKAPKSMTAMALAKRIGRACELNEEEQAALNQAAINQNAVRRRAGRVLGAKQAVEAARMLRSRVHAGSEALNEANRHFGAKNVEIPALMELNEDNLRYVEVADLDAASRLCFENQDAICIVTAPMGVGKTEKLLKAQIDALEAREGAVVINHRRSLVADSCQRLGLRDYRHSKDAHSRLGICVDSIPKFQPSVKGATLLAVDEFAQVIAATCLPGPMAKQPAVQGQLIEAIKNTPRVILTEAGFSPESIVFIARAERKIIVIDVQIPEKNKDVVILSECTTGKDVLTQVKRWLQSGEKVLVATDSSEAVSNLAGLCQELGLAESEYACVNSDTAPGHSDLLKDINNSVSNLKLLAYSPTIQSGVSLVAKHFTKHLVFGHGVIQPSDLLQMACRDRTAETLYFAFAQDVHSGLETSIPALHEEWIRSASEENLKGRLKGFMTAADVHRATHQAALNAQINDCANNVVYLMEAKGWNIDYEDFIAEDEELEAAKATIEVVHEAAAQAIVDAPAVFGQEWRELEKRQERGYLELVEVPTFKRGVLSRALALDSVKALETGGLIPVTREHVDYYDDGRVIPRLRAMEMIIGDALFIRQESDVDSFRIMLSLIHI